MKKKIDHIIKHLLKKIDVSHKYIFISKYPTTIEYIKNKHISKLGYDTKFFTIETFLEKISGLQISDNYSILLNFFSLFKENDLSEKKWKNFFHWGPKILNDFQDIDTSMVNPDIFFYSVISAEKIKQWDPNNSKKTKFIFWEKIHKYYYILQSQLLKKGITYPGMLFRIIIPHLNFFLSKISNTKIIFIKEIILNEYEKIFVRKIVQNHQGFFYDVYNIKKNKKKDSKCIKIIEVSKEIEQLRIVKDIIFQLIKKGEKPHNILLIPGNNSLTIPLLNYLKRLKINQSININYSFKENPIYYTFYNIFQFLLNKEKLNKFNRKDVINILSNGYIQKFFLKKNSLLKKLKMENNSNFIPEEVMKKHLLKNDLWIIFQTPTNNIKLIISSIISFIRKLKKLLFANSNKHCLELKFLVKLENYIQKIKIIIRKKEKCFYGVNDILYIYKQFSNMESIRYIRKNTRGLYITNFLDIYFKNFESVIITSFNEGVIPPNMKSNSFIPFDIREKLHINHLNNDFYFQHFLRIFQSSKKTFLIYKNQPDEINSGEKSRFIHQIEIDSEIPIEKKIHNIYSNMKTHKRVENPIVIEKTQSIIHHLHQLVNKGLSPSSIHLYNYNPLLFYYKKILNINLNDVENFSFKKEIGKITHKTLNILYSPIKNNFITINRIHEMKNIYEYIIKKKLLEKKKIIKENQTLFYYIITNYVKNFISWDEKLIQNGHKIFLREIECNLSTRLNIGSIQVNLHGIIDRIDECDKITRILDYKIGFSKTKEMNVSLEKIENIFINPNYSNIMQLLIYVYLWFKYYGFIEKSKKLPILGIISPDKNGDISQVSINFFQEKKINITYGDYKKYFLPFLINRISEILNSKIPIIEKIY
ncbi:PD-(D/E)XK nuclease family protein [Blattabacterium cuenoti]|uniref:PD-(D/E)XK nuclease family protein n=1 Tax=Blattabacterium cuenoti TaxID=1653831 RepID=UPI00163B9D31|nr:PD-(D/E)XK nuclease family protein [Blattabacterium cuenoti]